MGVSRKKMNELNKLNVKIFADGANYEEMIEHNSNPIIKGLTTNPSLMKKAGISNYEDFCKKILKVIKKPLSFEVFADDIEEMEKQAEKISKWGENVYVKIPITNTKNITTDDLMYKLSKKGIKLNVTAIMTENQIKIAYESLNKDTPCYISVFAGRIADTGIDPLPTIKFSVNLFKEFKNAETIWASPRELLNIFQANDCGCEIITVTGEILKKTKMIGYNLDNYSLDTVKMFYQDALSAGFKI